VTRVPSSLVGPCLVPTPSYRPACSTTANTPQAARRSSDVSRRSPSKWPSVAESNGMGEEAKQARPAATRTRQRVSIGQSMLPVVVLHAWRKRGPRRQVSAPPARSRALHLACLAFDNAALYAGSKRVGLGLKLRYALPSRLVAHNQTKLPIYYACRQIKMRSNNPALSPHARSRTPPSSFQNAVVLA